MTSTTHPEFNGRTEALTVAAAYAPLIKNRRIVITGVNKLGIGYTTAEAFASQAPQCLILAGRSMVKLQECMNALRSKYPDIDYRLLQLDLSSQESVRKASSTMLNWADVPTIDLVIHNAGVMNIQERTLSPEGVELHLATNHVGPFLFTNLIMPRLIAAAEASERGSVRVINVSSVAAYLSALRTSDMSFSKPTSDIPDKEKPNATFLRGGGIAADDHLSYIPLAAYGHSKACNILFSVALNEKMYEKDGILSLALHPGEARSELSRTTDQEWYNRVTKTREPHGFFWKSLTQSASTTLVAALDPKLERPERDGRGYFLNDCQIGKAPVHAVDEIDASKLWELSEDFVGEKFAW